MPYYFVKRRPSHSSKLILNSKSFANRSLVGAESKTMEADSCPVAAACLPVIAVVVRMHLVQSDSD
jgi:hypothetical protein